MPPLNKDFDEQESMASYSRSPLQDQSNQSFSALPKQPLKKSKILPQATNRRVDFEESARRSETISREDYSKEEIQDCWYTPEDYATFRQDIYTTVYLVKIDPPRVDDIQYTMRGVEHRTEEASERRKQIRSLAKYVVLDEQDFQSGLGEKDSELMACVYRNAARPLVQDALQRAAANRLVIDENQRLDYELDAFFNDNWISSISSYSELRCCYSSCILDETSAAGDLSGFDNSWLQDIAVSS